MEGVQSYFTWNDGLNKSEDFVQNQFDEIVKTIESEEAKEKESKGNDNDTEDKPRNLPQLYALKGYLHARLDKLDDAENCFIQAIGKCKKENEGYKKVIYESLAHLCALKGKQKNNDDKKYGPCDAEVFAMRAHSASYLRNDQDAIKFFEKALDIEETPEWCFGYALALNHNDVGRKNYDVTDKIERFYRRAIKLDASYDLAKLKLVKQLSKKRRTMKRIEEINDLVNPIIEKIKSDSSLQEQRVVFFEEIANSIIRFRSEDGEDLLLRCYKLKPKSEKTLRGLGSLYSNRWQNKQHGGNTIEIEQNLKKAIKYLTEIDTGKYFDKTLIAEQHRKAYEYFKRQKKEEEKKEHKEKCEEHIKILIEWLDQNESDVKGQIEVCFRLSKMYQTLQKYRLEKEYLFKILNCASKEKEFEQKSYVKCAKKRLQSIANEEQ